MKRLAFSPAARDDLEAIALYIAELEAKAQQAAVRPASFPARDAISPGLRAVVHKRYLLFFRELEDEVRIVRVLHGSRDLSVLLTD